MLNLCRGTSQINVWVLNMFAHNRGLIRQVSEGMMRLCSVYSRVILSSSFFFLIKEYNVI